MPKMFIPIVHVSLWLDEIKLLYKIKKNIKFREINIKSYPFDA